MENFFFVCSDWDRVGIKLRKNMLYTKSQQTDLEKEYLL